MSVNQFRDLIGCVLLQYLREFIKFALHSPEIYTGFIKTPVNMIFKMLLTINNHNIYMYIIK